MSKIVTFNQLGRYGRFCNGMFQIAGTIGIARKNGFDFAFPLFINHDHKNRFGSTEDIDLYKHFVHPLPVYNGPTLPELFIHWGYHDIKLKNSTSISGHLQSQRYFDHCLDEVKYWFEMHNEPRENDYCAIHCRYGDYDNAYHPILDESYYLPAMDEFGSRQKFLVFSDDIPVAKKIFGKGVEYSEGRNYIEDFKLMKACRHFIIGNSSYSAMAAILGNAEDKRVIAPSPWFGPKYTNITGQDIYNPEWKVIEYSKQLA